MLSCICSCHISSMGSVGDTFLYGWYACGIQCRYWFVKSTPSATLSPCHVTRFLSFPFSLFARSARCYRVVYISLSLSRTHTHSAFLSFPPSCKRGSEIAPLRAHPVGHAGWLHPLGRSGPKRQTRIERRCTRRGRKEERSLSNLYWGLCHDFALICSVAILLLLYLSWRTTWRVLYFARRFSRDTQQEFLSLLILQMLKTKLS